MTNTTPVRVASFHIQAAAFPSHHWIEFRKMLNVKKSQRTTGGPPWQRIDGPGFTLWLSEVRLADGRTFPPTWELRLESLAELNPAGEQRWLEVCTNIEQFIRTSALPLPSTKRPNQRDR